MEEQKTKKCPFCGEEIDISAEKCPACEENVNDNKNAIKCVNCGMFIDSKLDTCPYCKNNPRELSIINFYIRGREKMFFSIMLIFINILLLIIDINLLIDNGSLNGWINSVIVILSLILSFLYADNVKNIVINIGRKIIDIGIGLCFLVSLGIIITGIVLSCNNATKEFVEFWWFFVGAIVYFIITISANYILYLLININDNIKNINAEFKEKNK